MQRIKIAIRTRQVVLERMGCALEAAGVEFVDADKSYPGVRLRQPPSQRQPLPVRARDYLEEKFGNEK